MAHQIENDNAFYTGKKPWHDKGIVLASAPTPEQAWKLAYPWTLEEYADAAAAQDDNGNYQYQIIPERKQIVRSDGQWIANVSSTYEIKQPMDAFEFFRPLIGTGRLQLESGASLYNGRKLFVLGKIGAADITATDQVKAYLLLATSFDGSLAYTIKSTNTRVVCDNTLTAALRNGKNEYRFRHTASIHDRVDQAQRDILLYLQSFEQSIDAYRSLQHKKVSAKDLEAYVKTVLLPVDADPTEISEQLKEKIRNVISLNEIEEVPAARGTMWSAYNAVTKYLSHNNSYDNSDTKLNSLYFGQSQVLNSRALSVALAA